MTVKCLSLLCALATAFGISACDGKDAPADVGTPPQTEIVEQVTPDESQNVEQSDNAENSAGETEQNTDVGQEETALQITVGAYTLSATFADNSSADAFRELLQQGPVTVQMEDYGGFEKVGPLGTELVRNDERITTQPGDVILYQGDQITIYYGTNTWSFTRLAHINDVENLIEKLGEGTVTVTFSLE